MREEIEFYTFEANKHKIYVEKLTDRQREFVKVIEQYKYENKKVPSVRDICKLMNLSSTRTIQKMINRLKLKGYDFRLINYQLEKSDK